MDCTSTLETLEVLSNGFSRHCAHHAVVWENVYILVKVIESQEFLMVGNKTPFSLYFDS